MVQCEGGMTVKVDVQNAGLVTHDVDKTAKQLPHHAITNKNQVVWRRSLQTVEDVQMVHVSHDFAINRDSVVSAVIVHPSI